MKNPIYIFYKYSLLILFLYSMFAWFTWGYLKPVIFLAVIATFTLAYISGNIYSITKNNIIPIILLSLVQLYVVFDQNVNAMILALLRIFVISFLLVLKDRIKIDLFRFFTKAFATLMAISLTFYILFLIGVPLPYSKVEYLNYTFNNYYFFLDFNNAFIRRFSSVFLEPGQLGMIISFLLYGNKFNFKSKEVRILLIADILTFSLAAYVLTIISIGAFFYLKSRRPIYILVLIFLFLSSAYIFFTTLNNGDNLVNKLIIERLNIVDGNIEGNNRFSEDIDVLFDKMIRENSTIYTGLGIVDFSNLNILKGAGFKIFIITYGIIGTLFTFLFYLSLVLSKKSKFGFLFLVIYSLNFLQAAYPLWECELIIFILALPLLKFDQREVFRIEHPKAKIA